jgi:hypothetical protein
MAPHGAHAASTAPGAPTIGKATASSGQASLLFTAPSSTGGEAITGYSASCVTGTTTKTTVIGTGTSSPLVVKGLSNGSVYACSVKAINSVGTGRASAGVVVNPAAAPGAPTIRSVAGASARASVAFLAPSSTGGRVITGYTASCVSGSATALSASGTSSPINVTGLSNGSTYLCSVAAKNAIGTGASSGTLSVTLATVTARPGAPVVSGLTAGTGQISVAFTPGSGGTASSYTATCASSSSSKTVTGIGSPLVVTGLTGGTSYSCTVKASNTKGISTVSNTSSTTPTAAVTAVTYSTPANFASAVATSYTPTTTLTATTTVANRGYYMLSDAATASTTSNYASIGSTYSATTGYTLTSGTLSSASTYNDYLTKTMQLVSASDGYYRIDSYLHPNNSIDWGGSVSSPTLKFVNNFGKTSTTGNGFVTFAVVINATTKVATLQAKNRYTYATTSATVNGSAVYTGTYTKDAVFAATGYYVNLANSAYSLSATSASFYLYTTPLSLGMPSFMNPNSVAFVTNSAAPFLSKVTTDSVENTTTGIYSKVNSTYRSQLATVGTNAATKTAATAMLAAIKTAVEANGEKLRYSTDVYTAYRDAALATKLVSDSIADGTPGQSLVPYVYFTNEYATSSTGVKTYHPFMVVVSYGNQASPNGLKDVPHPPGSSGSDYVSATVTRYSNLENYIFMIPMKDYGQVTDVTTNVWPSGGTTTSVTKNLWYDMFSTTATANQWIEKNVYTWADSADNGILIDGSVIFPTFNNGLVPSHLAGELSASGCHVGQGGGGPHCHADGYQSGQGLSLYNDPDYVGKTHPPLLGFGYDGVAVFGRYRTTTDSAMLGYNTLDSFGAHNHDSIGYHYHAHTVSSYVSKDAKGATTTKDMYPLMKGAYIGSTNSIPFFRTGDSFTTNKYLGGTVK